MKQGAHVSVAGSGVEPPDKIGRYRYLVVAVVWASLCIAAADRANLSLLLADPGFLRDMGLEGSPERQGLVMTMLLLPYALSNIFLSPAADRWGPRRILALMAAFWAGAAVMLGTAASYSILLAGRVVRGTAEGPLFPVANRYVRSWFPPSERGGANAIWSSGQRLGLALSVPLFTVVIAAFGWRGSFFLQALLVVAVVLPTVWFLTGDRPEEVRRVGKAELLHITRVRPEERGGQAATWRQQLPALLRNYQFWLAVVFHFANLAVYFGLVTWLPKYLRDARGFDVGQMVIFASLPHLVSVVTGVSFGVLSDRIGRHRALFCTVSLSGTSAAICAAALVPDSTVSALLVVVGFGIWGINSPIFYAIMQRIIPGPIMATGIGIDNGLANFGSALAPTAVGFLIGATGSYLAGLLFLAGLGILGSLAMAVLAIQRY